jgi:thymidylate synthase (FAD)
MPIFVAREWFRHQIGLSRNEVSRRYVDSSPEVWCPSPGELRERDPNCKQGSKVSQIGGAEEASLEIREHCNKTIELYSNLLEKGVAPEVARCVLPQGMYTEFIETGSLAAYARIARLRTDPSAQREIQLYARGVMSLLTPHFPVSWAALTI